MGKANRKDKRTKAMESFFDEMTGAATPSVGPASMAVDEQPSAAAVPASAAKAPAVGKKIRKKRASGAASMDTDDKPKAAGPKKRIQANHLRVQVHKPLKVNARGNNTAAQKKRRQQVLEKALERTEKINSKLSQMQGTKVRKLSLKKMY